MILNEIMELQNKFNEQASKLQGYKSETVLKQVSRKNFIDWEYKKISSAVGGACQYGGLLRAIKEYSEAASIVSDLLGYDEQLTILENDFVIESTAKHRKDLPFTLLTKEQATDTVRMVVHYKKEESGYFCSLGDHVLHHATHVSVFLENSDDITIEIDTFKSIEFLLKEKSYFPFKREDLQELDKKMREKGE